MATKTELNAYVATIKGFAKSKKTPFKGYVHIRNNQIQTYGSNVLMTLKAGIRGDGEYRLIALDTYLIDQSADLEMFKNGDYEDGINLKGVKWTDTVLITPSLTKMLLAAYGFVSTDEARPVLQQTVVEDGWVMATDGYRATAEKCNLPSMDNTFFSPTLMAAFKKLSKYGTWHYSVGTDEIGNRYVSIYNEFFTLTEQKLDAGYPDVMKLMSLTEPYDHLITLPVANLCKLADKNNQHVKVNEDTSLSLGNNMRNDFFATPLRANVETVKPYLVPHTFEKRVIIMPLADKGQFGVSLPLIKDLANKSGEITLTWAAGKLTPLVVVE